MSLFKSKEQHLKELSENKISSEEYKSKLSKLYNQWRRDHGMIQNGQPPSMYALIANNEPDW